jgi:hypothetical protein
MGTKEYSPVPPGPLKRHSVHCHGSARDDSCAAAVTGHSQGSLSTPKGTVSTHSAVLAHVPPVGQHCIFPFAGALALHPQVNIYTYIYSAVTAELHRNMLW